jgi:dihydrofolate reductase
LLNRVTRYVGSRTLADSLACSGSSVVLADLGAAVALMKERHDEVHVIGSLDLTQSLLRLDLVDRLSPWVYPLLLGTGKQLFADGTAPRALRLTDFQDLRLRHAADHLRNRRRSDIREDR